MDVQKRSSEHSFFPLAMRDVMDKGYTVIELLDCCFLSLVWSIRFTARGIVSCQSHDPALLFEFFLSMQNIE